ncbi:MAG: DUF2332 domain-containing protein [Rhizomicrobium sp.]
MNDTPMDYWTWFAREASRIGSPLYARIAEGIGNDEDMKAIAAHARAGQPHANMILAAVHFLLLRGADHPLKRFYPTMGGAAVDEDPFPAFRDFCLAYRAEVEKLIAAHVTNTNEVGRSAVLHPGFRAAAAQAGEPLNLIEIGPSAGLNMIWDSYGIEYHRADGSRFETADDSPLRIACELRGEKTIPTGRTPQIKRRIGLERDRVDLEKPDDRDWLRALIFADQTARLERLDCAIALFRAARPEIRSGDALELLPDALRAVPETEPLCVYHTIVTYQFSHEMRAALDDILTVAGLRRPIWRLAMEGEAKNGDWTYWLTLSHYRDGTIESQTLAQTHPHGTWLEWQA